MRIDRRRGGNGSAIVDYCLDPRGDGFSRVPDGLIDATVRR
jgi:hypothetical protein